MKLLKRLLNMCCVGMQCDGCLDAGLVMRRDVRRREYRSSRLHAAVMFRSVLQASNCATGRLRASAAKLSDWILVASPRDFTFSFFFFFSSRRRHTRSLCDWSSDVCSSD